MRGRDFLDKMELVSPIYVEGADRTPIIRPKQWPKFVVAAACLCLMAWGAWSFTGGFGREPGYVAGPGESEGLEWDEMSRPVFEPCPGTLGFDQCWVRRSGEPDAAIWLYYTRKENGQYRLVAQSWWNAKSAAPYEVDLDGDGVKELIFNLNYEDGLREIQIIRNGDGEIQNWYFDNAFLRDHWAEQGLTVLDGATEHIRSYYDPDRGIVLEADCYDSTGKEVLSVEVFHDLEHFKYFTDERHTYADEIGEPTPQPTEPPEESFDVRNGLESWSCSSTLGFGKCVIVLVKGPPGFKTWYYYAKADGAFTQLGVTYSYDDEPDVYRVDLDGDGVEELICNNTGGTGAQSVYIYRNHDGVIEEAWLDWAFWEDHGIDTMGANGDRAVWYDPERGFVATGYDTGRKLKEEIVQDMDYFKFEPFEPFEPANVTAFLKLASFPIGVGCDELLHDDVASIAPEPCPATLGYENCVMTWEESPQVMIWRFYAQEGGQYQLIAEARNLGDEPDVYRVDLDGDGVDELICNWAFAYGESAVVVYRNRDGQVELGCLHISDDWWDTWGLDLINGVATMNSYYDPAQGFMIKIDIRDKNDENVQYDQKTVIFQGLEHFVFVPYDTEPVTIPLGVATVKVDS